MTIKELSQLYWLKREIEDIKLEINALKVPYVSAVRLGKMPCGYAEGQAAERRLERMEELKIKLRLKNINYQRELRRFARFLKTVPDDTTRKALFFRYARGLIWRDVGRNCGISGDNARIICRRCFLEKEKKERRETVP